MKKNTFNKKLLLLPVAGLVIIVMLATWLLMPATQPASDLGRAPNSSGSSLLYTEPTQPPAEIITLVATQAGQTAFDLLRSQAEVAFQEYPFGVFISGINGLAADDQHYWAIYYNGAYAEVGADQLKLQPNETVEFRYELITDSPM